MEIHVCDKALSHDHKTNLSQDWKWLIGLYGVKNKLGQYKLTHAIKQLSKQAIVTFWTKPSSHAYHILVCHNSPNLHCYQDNTRAFGQTSLGSYNNCVQLINNNSLYSMGCSFFQFVWYSVHHYTPPLTVLSYILKSKKP